MILSLTALAFVAMFWLYNANRSTVMIDNRTPHSLQNVQLHYGNDVQIVGEILPNRRKKIRINHKQAFEKSLSITYPFEQKSYKTELDSYVVEQKSYQLTVK